MTVEFKLGKPQPKQREFLLAKEKYVAFGGARGGGKSWVVREKAKRLAIKWAGIKILIVRKTYTDLRENHILPLQMEIPQEIAKWKEMDRSFVFFNGSRIRCAYFDTDNDYIHFSGQEYDVIFMEEATQFLENAFTVFKACLRGANDFPKRLYLTCNPDGIGFLWVKRLFVTRDFMPEEDPSDYRFIQSLVDDNQALVKANPDYVKQLESLPEEMRKRWRYGSWDVAEGQMFDEFDRHKHVIKPIPLDPNWRRYVSIDYGLDRLAALWYAISDSGYVYVYKEYCESNLIISKASEKLLEYSQGEDIHDYLAPPDLWSRSQETGKSRADIFYENGVQLTKVSNDREAGWLAVKEMLKLDAEGTPKMRIFDNCRELIRYMPAILRDPKHPNDTLNEPHEVTHINDSCRYFSIYWTAPNENYTEKRVYYSPDRLEDYRNATSDAERQYIIKKMGGLPL